ncbi:phosphonoacetaldehyde hydrolase [Vibrio sp. FNV 38]|nr:phosphonoacetaldehyde hydrolase [Vibrio sp. FNV 38]
MNKQIEAVIFDWAGTVVDFGSFAPTQIFVDAFQIAYDFEISLAEARGPMGMGKIDHIRTLLNDKIISKRWLTQFGECPTEQHAQEIYHTFMPLQIKQVVKFAEPIDGALASVAFLREKSIKIGSCSGYPKPVMDALVPATREHGYSPDCVVASDEIAAGSRPGPWMALKNVIDLGVTRVSNCVKVDDAVAGIHEGLNAGMWTIGLSVSGNEFGATPEEFQAMTESEIELRKQAAEQVLYAAGAHYVIGTIAELPNVIEHIEARIQKDDFPARSF